MKTLAILFTLINYFYSNMNLLPYGFQRTKANIDYWFLTKCETVGKINDQTLMVKLKPWMLSLGVIFLILGGIILEWRGPKNPDTTHLSFAGFGTLSIVAFGLVAYSKLKKVSIDSIKKGFKLASWLAFGLIVIILAFLGLYAFVNQVSIVSVLLSDGVLQSFGEIIIGCLVGSLIADLILLTLMIFIPYSVGQGIIWCVRRTAYIVVTKWQHNPFKIPLAIVTGFFLIPELYSYFLA